MTKRNDHEKKLFTQEYNYKFHGGSPEEIPLEHEFPLKIISYKHMK